MSIHISSISNNVAAENYWRLSRFAMSLAIGLHVAFAASFALLKLDSLVLINLAPIVIYAGCIVLANRRMRLLVTVLTLFTLAAHSLLLTRLLGLASGFQYYVWLVVPLIILNTEMRMRTKMIFAVASVATCIAAFAWLLPQTPLMDVTYSILSNFFIFNVASFLIANALLAFTYAHAVGEASRQLHEMATTDALTGLANRRRMLEIAAHEIGRAKRAYQSISILLLDIDHFKSINDRFGHAGGDNILRAVTHILGKTIRGQDYIARWGGEEFLVLMPGVGIETARAAAERIRLTLATSPLQASDAVLESVAITCTVGVSEWHVTETIEQCIERSDIALYRGKRNGRDRVEIEYHISAVEKEDTVTLALLDRQRTEPQRMEQRAATR
jgi:diguanylate cyclase